MRWTGYLEEMIHLAMTEIFPAEFTPEIMKTEKTFAEIAFEAVHLKFPPEEVSFDRWVDTGRTLADMHSSIPWWVGDWINYGEANYGETYSQGLALWDYGYQTLSNMAWVARQYPPETRTSLSWTHHRYAASLEVEERTKLLEKAKEEEWTSRQLQIEVAKLKEPDTGTEVAVWVRYTVEISTNEREIKRTFSDINPFLTAVNEFAEKGLLDKPAVKLLEVGTCNEPLC